MKKIVMKYIRKFNESIQGDEGSGDYVKNLSNAIKKHNDAINDLINRHRQSFFNEVQKDISDVLGKVITKNIRYNDYLYYETSTPVKLFGFERSKNRFFIIMFDKSSWGEEYCGIIEFNKDDSHEFFTKTSLIKILKNKKLVQ